MEPNRLCKRCSRALTASKTLWQPRPVGDPDWPGERFFHSKNTKQMLRDSVIAAGCHLCIQVSQDDNFPRAGDDQRVMVECSRSRAFEGDEGNIPIVSFSAISCAEWDDNWASLPDPSKDEEPQGDSDMTPLAKFKLERTDGSAGAKSLLPRRLPDGSMFVLPSSTNSPEAFGLVRHWLDDCLNNHPECKGSNFKRLPTRLVDVGVADNNGQKKLTRPRIFVPNTTSQTPATIPYLTLSHSWALTGSSLRLTTKNIEDWQKPEAAEHGGIPIDGLAQTFLDAMRITQQLGYRYIWIDSLCIMQDSSEDWKREAQTMAAVYGNSLLTIFASGMGMAGGQGANADTCFSVRNPLKVYSPIITSPLCEENASFYAIREKYEPNVDEMLWGANQKNPLLSRGWIVQERLLSPRIIYYGADELYWECRLHEVSESCPFGTGLKKDAEASQSIWTANAKSVYQDLQDPFPASLKATGMDMGNDNEDAKYAQHLHELAACWMTLLTYYTATELTYPSDRLIALAGMVTAIEDSKGWTYTLGSWQELWPFDLLWGFDSVLNVELFNPGWYPDDSEKRRQDRDEMAQKLLKGQSYPESHASTTLGLPSWSWAATEAPKSFWFGSSGSLTWKCQVDVFGRTTTGMPQESGILALKTYKKQLYDMPPIDLSLMWDDDESFYSKDEVCCLLVFDHFARGGRRALQRGLMVVQVQMAESAPSSEVADDTGTMTGMRFYCRRVGKWENTWGPPVINRSKDEEAVVYLC
ncbi:heterokaryon incompatibility protein-domain-containing protein [Neurospora tetraspora]|uniref:Heterokaryon incompatibility protein-domain-containing protein n=1 Tax=Neurospora tetraspora TaxID=94610 RepID=A0AAE0MUU4_9PEZI|nr:heterokaryon incompatibility protein-domain-containing protein [Neurospora tetraspora]